MSPAYRLDELGWLQFQELCTLLLEPAVARDDWGGSADDRRDAFHDGDLALPGLGPLPGPVHVAVVWPRGRPAAALEAARESLGERMAFGQRPQTILLLTTVRSLHGFDGALVAGSEQIGRELDASPALRLRMPAVLGVRDLDELIDPAVGEVSTLERAAAEELARVFVATAPYRRALEVLGRHSFVVLTGPPEMGKTAIARMVGLAQLCAGWEAHECRHPDDFFRAFRTERPQVMIADDAFGSTEYRPDAAERWARELDRVLSCTDERHWLIWTSRPAPLRAGLRRVHREHGLERFPAPGDVQVDASELDRVEKALILFRHAKAAGLTPAQVDYVKENGLPVVGNPYFTPERIRRYVGRVPVLVGLGVPIARELRAPTEAMAESLHALDPEHRDLLVAMLDAPPVSVSQRELAAAVRRHHDGGLSRPPSELVEELADHFLKVSEVAVRWVHPSWRDLVIDDLASRSELRAHFLSRCELEGVLLAVSSSGGAEGTRAFPLLSEDADWDVLGDRVWRLVPELEEHELVRLLWSLAEAVQRAPNMALQAEAESLAGGALRALGRRYRGEPAPLQVLEPWFELAYRIEEGDAPPVDAAWIELIPPLPLTPSEFGRIDDWLRLAALLLRYDPEHLKRLGFPDRCEGVIAALLELGRSHRERPPDEWEPVARMVVRLRVLLDGVKAHRRADAALEVAAELDYPGWPEPPEPAPGPPADPDYTVARILRDL